MKAFYTRVITNKVKLKHGHSFALNSTSSAIFITCYKDFGYTAKKYKGILYKVVLWSEFVTWHLQNV